MLRRIGWDKGQLKEFILSDVQIQTAWGNTRLPFLTTTPWGVEAADDSPVAAKAAEAFRANLANLDMHNIIEGLMDAVALGYSVAEILWQTDSGPKSKIWEIADLVPKPSHWFRFDTDGGLRFLSDGNSEGELMPDANFLVLKHRAGYGNPYGESLFSRLYWPVLFKKHGLEWWVKFVERFGSLSYFGKYDLAASEQQQKELLNALVDLLSGSAAVGPDNTQIEPIGDTQRTQGANAHKHFEDWLDKAIAKAILGQNLSSDSGEKGTQALGNIQFRVLEAITRSDQRLIASAFNRLARRYTDYNFGADAHAPLFVFEQAEDLKAGRAERDQKLYAIGWRPGPEYIEQHYHIPPEQFSIESAGKPEFSGTGAPSYVFSEDMGDAQQEFAQQMAGAGQGCLDAIQDKYFREIEKQSSFEGALKALSKPRKRAKNNRRQLAKFAGVVDNLRHVSRNVGAHDTAPARGAALAKGAGLT